LGAVRTPAITDSSAGNSGSHGRIGIRLFHAGQRLMKKPRVSPPLFGDRDTVLEFRRAQKMARSSHRYVRGSTRQFYEWLGSAEGNGVPEGPPVWICGDCHVGNLGPVADAAGQIRIHIRDLDQTIIGNPAHDLLRLALSLASSARGSDLPGVATARMLEAIMDGYEVAFEHDFDETEDKPEPPEAVRLVMKQAAARTWRHLAKERLEDTRPTIPLGKKFWPVNAEERAAIDSVVADHSVARLATLAKSRDDDAKVELIDSAYWMKGCSSLGLLRYAVLLEVSDGDSGSSDLCLMDIKEAVESAAPAASGASMPKDPARRVVEGALHISPFLGERTRATTLLGRPVFIRELMPQDLKLELDQLTATEGLKAAEYLATVVGYAHARQMDSSTRASWQHELAAQRSKDLDAPTWLWSNVVGLLVDHEGAYLEHCRRYASTDQSE
jgi:uncharacterized protein (DUF2252 family)